MRSVVSEVANRLYERVLPLAYNEPEAELLYTNLNPNPSIEVDAAGYNAYAAGGAGAASHAPSSSNPSYGTKSLRFQGTLAMVPGHGVGSFSDHAVEPGKPYSAIFKMFLEQGANIPQVQVLFEWRTLLGAGSVIGYVDGDYLSGGNGTTKMPKINGSVAPANAFGLRVFWRLVHNGGSNEGAVPVIFLDGMTLVQADAAPPEPFDGDNNKAIWTGTAHASISELYDRDISDHNWPLLNYCEALIAGLQETVDLSSDSDDGPGWSGLLDIDRIPIKALPWLSQFVGVGTAKRLCKMLYKNGVPNPRAALDVLNGWTAYFGSTGGGNLTRYTSDATELTVARALATTISDTVAMNIIDPSASVGADVTNGTIIRLRARAKLAANPGGGTVTLGLAARLGNPNFAASSAFVASQASPVIGQWYDLTATYVVPPGYTKAGLDIMATGVANGANAVDLRVTKAQVIVIGNVADDPGYFDGDSEDSRWTSARHASASELYADEADAEFSARIKPLIIARTGWQRGTSPAMKTAAQQWLTGGKTLYFRERDPNAWRLIVRSITSETPDVEKVRRELLSLKPGGIIMDYAAIAGQDYTQVNTDHASYNALAAAYANYDQVRTDF